MFAPPSSSPSWISRGGGRFQCEMTDVDPKAVKIGDPRRADVPTASTRAGGIHNYFWKGRGPIRDGRAS